MRKKLLRFQDNAAAPNVIEPGKPLYHEIKGNWHDHFGNKHPLILELGCGRGTYTIALAQRYAQKNFIGVDIKGARLWAGSQAALHNNLTNAAFLRADITHLNTFFAPKEINEIYIPFPDPRPRDKEEKKRLTSPRFLALYQKLLPKGGTIHLKTDNTNLFAYTCEVWKDSAFEIKVAVQDIYTHLPKDNIHCQVQTPYEKHFLDERKKIKYMKAVLK